MSPFTTLLSGPSVCRCPQVLAVIVMAAFPAVAADVKVYPAKGVNLAAYKTFRMLPPRVLTKSGVQEDEPTVSPAIRAALRKEFVQKGLTEVAENPDLDVASGAMTESSPQIEMFIYSMAPYDMSVTGALPIATFGRYNAEGALIVNLIDPRTKKSVWVGISKRSLAKPSKREGDINKAAEALFKKYPSLK